MTAPRPAWREPMVWLVLAIPLATVVGGLATLWLAESSAGNDSVPEPVQRTAQVQDADLGPDLAAARLGLSARVAFPAGDIVRVDLTPSPPAGPLVLRFVHGTRAEADLALPLAASDGHWQARLPPMPAADWRLVLSDGDGHWRLVGRLPRQARQALLQPAVSAP